MFGFIALIITFLFASVTFTLANIVRNKEDDTMNNVIEVTPNKDGKIFITLYGTKYEIMVKEPVKEVKKPAKTEE